MKSNRILKALASTLVCLTLSQSAMADIVTQARKVYAENQESVFGLRALLKLNVTKDGQQAGSNERQIWTNATVIDKGLLVVSYKSLLPDAAIAQRPGIDIETEISELKLINASGEEFEAKLVLHDEALGVAFVAVDPKGDKSADFQAKSLDFSNDSKLELLQPLFVIGRMGESMRFQGHLKTCEVTSIVERPRTLAQLSNMSTSTIVFNESGQLVGMVVTQVLNKNQQNLTVLLPSKYILGLLDQAKAKQAELGRF